MKQLVYSYLVLGAIAVTAPAWAAAQACPKLSARGQSEATAGEPITFTADLTGGDPAAERTYNWTTSDGTISSGQGTSSITVNTSDMGGDRVTASVSVGGLDRRCSNSASATTAIRPAPKPRKFDEYGTLKPADEHARLDNFAVELQSNPTSQGYVIVYGGRRSAPGAAKSAATQAGRYLGETRGIDYSRIMLLDGGYRELPFTELWIVPSGGAAPKASPTVNPSATRACSAETKAATYESFLKNRLSDQPKAYEAAKQYLSCPAAQATEAQLKVIDYLKRFTKAYEDAVRRPL